MGNKEFNPEVSKYDPPVEEKKKDALISLFYIAILIFIGLPMWYITTSTYRASLPLSEISEFSNSKIVLALKVNIINFDAKIELDDLFKLQDKLLHELEEKSKKKNSFVNLIYSGYVRQASKDEIFIYQNSRSLSDFDKIDNNLHGTGDIYVFLIPNDSNFFSDNKNGIIRSKSDRNIILLPFKSINQIQKVVVSCVTNLMIRNEELDVVYQAAIDVPEKESLNAIPSHLRSLLTRVRTATHFDWTFSLIVPNPKGGPRTEWNFPSLEHFYLEPLLRRLAPFISISTSSQIVYGVYLEKIWPSKKRLNKRIYSREDLTHLVNGIESYLGSNQGLNFISYMTSNESGAPHIQAQGNNGKDMDAFTVPRWGGVVFLNNSSVPIDGQVLMNTFLTQILSLMGFSRLESNLELPFEELDISMVAPWQLHKWLRERTIENIAITRVTLQSILVLLDKVGNMVIRDDVANHIFTATTLSQNSLKALKSITEDNALQIAFLSSKQALQEVETAFFHPSLLELLYFQDDQKIGIYIPLFVPVILPLILAAFKVKPFLMTLLKLKVD